jgi:hypothetical protein
MTDSTVSAHRQHTRGFFTWGLVCLLIAVVGFWPSYVSPILGGSYTNIVDTMPWHVLSVGSWMVLIVSQPLLAVLEGMDLHRYIGMFGAVVAMAVVVTGVVVQTEVMTLYAARGDKLNAVTVPFFRFLTLFIYLLCVAAAIALRDRPDWHKRLMILATLSVLQATYGRIFANILDLPDIAGPMSGVSHVVLMVAFLGWDRFSHDRFHPVTLWGTVVITLAVFGPVPVVGTAWWQAVAAQIAGVSQ